MMADRTLLKRGICVTTILALLVAVMVSPTRLLCQTCGLSRLSCLRFNPAIPPARAVNFSLKSISLRATPIKAVRSENDEEDERDKAADPAWCVLDPSFSPPLKTWQARVLLTPGPHAQASQPLRC